MGLSVETAATVAALPNLTVLFLSGLRLDPDGIAMLRRLPRLEMLLIDHTAIDAAAVSAIAGLRSLRILAPYGSHGGGEPTTRLTAQQMREFGQLPHLTVLSLATVTLDDEALRALPPTLERVDFGRIAGITAEGLLGLTAPIEGLEWREQLPVRSITELPPWDTLE